MSADTLFRLAALNTEYAGCIDADRLEDWPGLFLEQCLYKITTADNHRRGYAAGLVYADSRAMLTDRVAALREANIYERQSYRHIVGMPALRATHDIAVPGGAHDARRSDGSVRRGRLPRSRARRGRQAAFRRARRGLRQLAHRHAAGDTVIGVGDHCRERSFVALRRAMTAGRPAAERR
jgi:hypothetical protein